MPENLSKDTKIVLVSSGAAAGETELDSSAVDTAGYDGVCFIAVLGTVTDGSVLQLTAEGSVTSGGDYAAQGAQTSPVTAAGSSDTLLIADTQFPAGSKGYRFMRAALTRTAQNAAVSAILAILYRGKSLPVTPDASVLASALALGS